jgi:hypothetical protein
MYQLSSFSSVFELSAAVFLAYGLIKSVYRFPLNIIENAKLTLSEFGADHPDSRLPSAIGLLERMYTLERIDLDKFYIFMSRLSVFLTLVPLTCLIISGFFDPKVSLISISLVLLFTVALQPVLAIISWKQSNKLLFNLDPQRKILSKETHEVLFVSQSKATAKKQT